MKLGTWFLLAALFGLVLGLGYLLFPGPLLNFFGITADSAAILAGRFFGGALFGYGVLAWLVRDDPDSPTLKAIVRSLFVTSGIGAVLSIIGVTSGVFNAMGWIAVVVLVLLAGFFGYFSTK